MDHSLRIAPDKWGVHIFLFFFYEKVCCGYSLEAPRWGAYYEYPQHMFFMEK